MTIKVEREALISVLSRAPSWTSSSSSSSTIQLDEDEFVLVNLPNKPYLDSGLERCSSYTDDDTLSTASESLSTDSSLTERRVSFAPSMVTDVWLRDYTPKEEVPSLYYSSSQTERFRQEYRLERKVLSELSIDADAAALESGELSDLVCTASAGPSPGRHSISRVVVLHNNRLETYVTPDEVGKQPLSGESGDFSFDSDSFWNGSLTWY